MTINQYPFNSSAKFTPFKEQLVAQLNSIFNLKPTWGLTDLREVVSASGVSAGAIETGGEIKLSTGVDGQGAVRVQTNQRGQYQAGTQGQAGVAVRIPTFPTGTQDARWGYFDESNGFGFGMDAAGIYTFVLKGGVLSKTHKDSWNINPTLDFSPSSGVIYQIDFTWYGYGNIVYNVVSSSGTNVIREVEPVHRFSPGNAVSIQDPNQPITIEAFNGGGASSGNLDIYVGGRQFSVLTGQSEPQVRFIADDITAYALSSGINEWEPIMTIREKATHGTSNRRNSVSVAFDRFEALVDQNVEVRFTYSRQETYGGGGFAPPESWPSSESAIEVKKVSAGTYGAPSGVTLARIFASASKNNPSTVERRGQFPLLPGVEATLWVRKLTNLSTTISAILGWEEQW